MNIAVEVEWCRYKLIDSVMSNTPALSLLTGASVTNRVFVAKFTTVRMFHEIPLERVAGYGSLLIETLCGYVMQCFQEIRDEPKELVHGRL